MTWRTKKEPKSPPWRGAPAVQGSKLQAPSSKFQVQTPNPCHLFNMPSSKSLNEQLTSYHDTT